MLNKSKKKFNLLDDFENFFVFNGFAVFRNLIDKKLITKISKRILNDFKIKKKKKFENHEICNIICDELELSREYDQLISQKKIVALMQSILGRDICVFNNSGLWINNPTNKNPVLNKNEHVDLWTGTSSNTIMCVAMLTDADQYNSITVYPGTHLHGVYPVKNRTINFDDFNIKLNRGINLNLKKGDILIFHPLLVHSTTGQSKKNTRISLTLRYTSIDTEFSSQEKALGYRTLSVGPLNKIRRLIGSDLLIPFRTYGGKAAIDKRLSKIYDNSSHKIIKKR